MAMLRCRELGIEEPYDDRRLVVLLAVDRCAADAIRVAALAGLREGAAAELGEGRGLGAHPLGPCPLGPVPCPSTEGGWPGQQGPHVFQVTRQELLG